MKELMELLKKANVTADIHIEWSGIRGTGTPEDSQDARDILQYLAERGREAMPNPVVELIHKTPVGETVQLPNADGNATAWIILTKTDTQAELITADCITKRQYHNTTTYPSWGKSDIRKYLNGEFYDSLGTNLKDAIMEQIIKTEIDACTGADYTQDKVYLLEQRVMDKRRVVTLSGYTLTDEQLRCYDEIDACYWWLRSPRGNGTNAGIVDCSTGALDYWNVTGVGGVRPAITVKLN